MIGIIGAMQIEVDALKEMIDNPKIEKISGVEFTSGKIHNKDVVVAACGVGKVFAAIATEAMILAYKPDVIINSGVAGSLSEKLEIADVAVAVDVAQHDMDTTPLGEPRGYLSKIDLINIPCQEYANKVFLKCAEELGINCVSGRIVSGDQFIDTREKKTELGESFDAIACEMEGASVGHVCYVNDVPFIVVRAISDSLKDGSGMEFTEFLNVAAKNAIKLTSAFIKNY